MALVAGSRLGPYEVVSLLGQGGMGEVYKARDTRLGRTVAVKVLPSRLAADAERRVRFEREARAASALNHPHICALYDIGTTGATGGTGGVDYLVLEHLEGQTLADRLTKGPLPLEVALECGAQIADALAAAHRHGIVHRDLKPANVMLTRASGGARGMPDVKLLDFGLARLTEAQAPGADGTTLSGVGTVAGTVQYMAPEQVQGQATDARTDIFALGAVLYEMVTGARAFHGESAAGVAAAILEHEPPPIASRVPLTPPAFERLVTKCLEKDPDDRWQSARDVADELRWISSGGDAGGTRHAAVPRARSRTPLAVSVLAPALALGGAAIFFWLWSRGPAAVARGVERYELTVAPAEGVRGPDPSEIPVCAGRPSRLALAVSPDGRRLAFTGYQGTRQGLWLRDLSEEEARWVPNTDGAEWPFFSPDGRYLGFWAGGAIRKVEVTGGTPALVCETEALFGAAWSEDGRIVFARREGPLSSVSGEGGTPVSATVLGAGETSHRLPSLLPGGRVVLYSVQFPAKVIAEDLATHAKTEILKGDPARGEPLDARYVATGHLVYARRGKLEAVPFDAKRLTVSGPPVALEDVMQALGADSGFHDTGVMQAAVSPGGSLFYLAGGLIPTPPTELVWRDLNGRRQPLEPLLRTAERATSVRISHDGRRYLLVSNGPDGFTGMISILEGATVTPITPPTMFAYAATWVPPDDRQVAFTIAGTDGTEDIFLMPADRGAAPRRLTTTGTEKKCQDWSRDGRTLIVCETRPGSGRDLLAVEPPPVSAGSVLDDDADERPLMDEDDLDEQAAVLSPDGRWLAYQAGRQRQAGVQAPASMNVFVTDARHPRAAVRVSPDNGFTPVWSPDGARLYYVRATDPGRGLKTMMAVDMAGGRPAGPPRELFTDRWFVTHPFRNFDLSPDGTRFLFIEEEPRPIEVVSRIQVVLNWTEVLRARVPEARRR